MLREEVIATVDGPLLLQVNASTDVGMKRAINEDSYLAAAPVFLVADGMGGHAHGDRASHQVVEVFEHAIEFGRATTPSAVLAAIAAANTAVRGLSAPDAREDSVAGSTLSGVALVETENGTNQRWMAFNVGDSRVYSWDGQSLAQLTVDHSAVQELINSGEITAEEAIHHQERNVITRAIGVDDDVEADIWLLPAGGTQCFMMCSDGLTKEVSDLEIGSLFAQAQRDSALPFLAQRLVSAALSSGGSDNITVVIVEAQMLPQQLSSDAGGVAGTVPAFLEQTLPRVSG
jgi:PPM family protein phosphatase